MLEDNSPIALDCIAKNLSDIGAISFRDYLDASGTAPIQQREQGNNAITRLHQACQRVLRSTEPLKFEFIEQPDSRNKQCILTIVMPDGARRSYATQPSFTKKNEAKLEAAKIAIDMGALDFLAAAPPPAERSSTTPSDSNSTQSKSTPDTFVDEVERCCLEWRAGRVTPHWVQFLDTKSTHKQGCALRIQLSPHVVRVYLCDPTFDSYLDAKEASARAAVSQGVLDFIRHGNGQSRPASPGPSTASTSLLPPVATTTPWTLQAFYDSLPRPFPESFNTNDAFEINAPGWLNTMVQNTRGGKLLLSFFFTSDGPPGLHGCLLKLDRPGEYKASLVDARFTKRSDAKAAVCFQAMSEGIGNYIRSIASTIDTKVTPDMRSFSSSLVYPALSSELSKIDAASAPLFEYDKERDAFSASLIIKLSNAPSPEQVRRYSVPAEYRNKADAKVAVICCAAQQGAVEFIRFRGGPLPDNYQSPYVLHAYDPDATRKRKQPDSAEDAEQGRPAKKRARNKRGKRRERHRHTPLCDDTVIAATVPIHPTSGDHIHDISRPGDMGLPQRAFAGSLSDLSQPGVGNGDEFGGADRFVGGSHGRQMHTSSLSASLAYPAMLDPRFGMGGQGYTVGIHPMVGACSSAPPPPPPESGPSRAMPGSSSRAARQRVDDAELEPGEVVSSVESEFSESSSRNEEDDVGSLESKRRMDSIDDVKIKGKGREISTANPSTNSRDGHGTAIANTANASHVKKLIDHCTTHGRGTPSFHEAERQGRFQVWIVIGKERFDLPTTYGSVEEGRQRVARQVLARLQASG